MDVIKIIEQGEAIERATPNPWDFIPSYVPPLGVTALIILFIIIIVGMERGYIFFASCSGVLFTFLFLLGFVFYIDGKIEATIHSNKTYREEISKWGKEVVEPYLTTLPTETYEVTRIKINNGNTSNTLDTDSKTSKISLTITYLKDEEIQVLTTQANLLTILKETDKPYVEYVTLKEDLGNHYSSGVYHVKVYAPKGYDFSYNQ